MLLSGQDDDQLFAVLAVDYRYDDRAELAEMLHTVMVREFDLELGAERYAGLEEHTLGIMYNAAHDADVGHLTLLVDGFVRLIAAGGCHAGLKITAGELSVSARHREEYILFGEHIALCDIVLREYAAHQARERIELILADVLGLAVVAGLFHLAHILCGEDRADPGVRLLGVHRISVELDRLGRQTHMALKYARALCHCQHGRDIVVGCLMSGPSDNHVGVTFAHLLDEIELQSLGRCGVLGYAVQECELAAAVRQEIVYFVDLRQALASGRYDERLMSGCRLSHERPVHRTAARDLDDLEALVHAQIYAHLVEWRAHRDESLIADSFHETVELFGHQAGRLKARDMLDIGASLVIRMDEAVKLSVLELYRGADIVFARDAPHGADDVDAMLDRALVGVCHFEDKEIIE